MKKLMRCVGLMSLLSFGVINSEVYGREVPKDSLLQADIEVPRNDSLYKYQREWEYLGKAPLSIQAFDENSDGFIEKYIVWRDSPFEIKQSILFFKGESENGFEMIYDKHLKVLSATWLNELDPTAVKKLKNLKLDEGTHYFNCMKGHFKENITDYKRVN